MEQQYGLDILNTIQRKYVTGEGAHGYYPTDFRVFMDGLCDFQISDSDAVFDIGCGKGSSVIAFNELGFRNIGAVEYTKDIFTTLDSNLTKLGLHHCVHAVDDHNICQNICQNMGTGIHIYYGNATELNREFDDYNWFFLFNPFSLELTKKVIENILQSKKRRERKIYILYAEPIGHQIIMDTGKFEIVKTIYGDWADCTYYTILYGSK